MAPDRRYDDAETRAIFAIATRREQSVPTQGPDGQGFTLRELQDIGSEAGIHPDQVAAAARVVASRDRLLPTETAVGIGVSVGRVVPLSRRPTEAEWDALVTELRDLFAATGEVREQGGAREWSNGALRVLLEPTVEGYQLRLITVNRRLRSLIRMGSTFVVSGLVLLVAVILPAILAESPALSELARGLLPWVTLVGGGIGFVAFSRLKLPKWIAERGDQFERIANRAQDLLGSADAIAPDS